MFISFSWYQYLFGWIKSVWFLVCFLIPKNSIINSIERSKDVTKKKEAISRPTQMPMAHNQGCQQKQKCQCFNGADQISEKEDASVDTTSNARKCQWWCWRSRIVSQPIRPQWKHQSSSQAWGKVILHYPENYFLNFG